MAIDWDSTEARSGEGGRLEPGPYIMRVLEAEDAPDRGYNYMRLDVAVGESANHYVERGWDGLGCYASYDESGDPDQKWKNERYKHMFQCMEASTPNGWKFDGDVHNTEQFVNCLVGAVIRDAEYEDRETGEVKVRLEVGKFFPAEELAEQKPMKMRELKGKRQASTPTPDEAEPSQASTDAYSGTIPF